MAFSLCRLGLANAGLLSLTLLAACSDQTIQPATLPVLPDERLSLAAPPAPGSEAQAEDDRIFAQTRRLVGSPRWALATSDADLHPEPFLRHYSCAIGFTLDLAKTPHLARIMTIVAKAETPRTSEEKHYWKRQRPFIGNDAPICVARSPDLAKSPSYPSAIRSRGIPPRSSCLQSCRSVQRRSCKEGASSGKAASSAASTGRRMSQRAIRLQGHSRWP